MNSKRLPEDRLRELTERPGEQVAIIDDDPIEPDDEPAEQSRGERLREFGRTHLGAIAVVLGVGITFAGVQFTRSDPETVPVTPVISSAVGGAPISATPTPVPMIRVHVAGAVVTPMVVDLPQGSRVQDAIAAAGGLAANADPAQLNLAAVLNDGDQVLIGTVASPAGQVSGQSGGTGGGGAAGKVSLNSANAAQLETIPGVGPVTAAKIIAHREANGPFTAVDQLLEISGIGDKTLAELAPYVQL
jgi:competence protein ComEA